MNREEYWLLEVAINRYCPLDVFGFDVSELEGFFNRSWHGLPRAELIETLYHLFQRGDLIAVQFDDDLSEVRRFIPDRQDIADGIDRITDTHYTLTAQGGARWEKVSRPKWDHYVRSSLGVDGDSEVISMNKQLVEYYLSLLPHFGERILDGTDVWSELTPWQATPWKTLPIGYCVQFYTEPLDTPFTEEDERKANEWRHFKANWYTRRFR